MVLTAALWVEGTQMAAVEEFSVAGIPYTSERSDGQPLLASASSTSLVSERVSCCSPDDPKRVRHDRMQGYLDAFLRVRLEAMWRLAVRDSACREHHFAWKSW